MSFLRSFGALSGASFVSVVANLVRGKLAAVLLGPAGVGAYNQLALSYNVASLTGSLATNNGIIQHGAEALGEGDRDTFANLASTMFVLLCGSSLLVAVVALTLSPWIANLLLGDSGRAWREVALLMAALPFAVFATLFRGLLGADQAVRDLVHIQVVSELGGMLLFAALLIGGFGLIGALIGYLSVHIIAAAFAFAAIIKRFGWASIRPSLRRFRWRIVQSNLGFGTSGFVMVGLSNLSMLSVNRMVIGMLGLGAAGLLSNALRLANVYLGAVTATALNYYLPAVARLSDPRAISAETSKVIRFYCLLLPPIMIAIVALSPWIVPLIFSKAFLGAVPLIVILVPTEFLRIIGESHAVPLIAKRRLVAHTLLFVFQTALFVGLSALFLPKHGLMGVVAAYVIAVLCYCCASLVTTRRLLDVRIDRQSNAALILALALLAAVSGAASSLGIWPTLIVALIAGALSVAVTLRDPAARGLIQSLIPLKDRKRRVDNVRREENDGPASAIDQTPVARGGP